MGAAAVRADLRCSVYTATVCPSRACTPLGISLPSEQPASLSVLYRISILEAEFTLGPTKQCKLMFKENRQIASIVFLAAITATLLLALIPGIPPQYRVPFIILAYTVQLLAWLWYAITLINCCLCVVNLDQALRGWCRYCLSYIPFARACVKRCLKKCCVGLFAFEEEAG